MRPVRIRRAYRAIGVPAGTRRRRGSTPRARAGHAGAVTVTSLDVAKRAGVSRSAVSQILNGKGEKFSEETRRRVLEAASALSYRPSAAGRSLVRGTSELVIALVPNTVLTEVLQELIDLLTDQLAAAGLTLLLRLTSGSEQSFEYLVAGMRPAAVVDLGGMSVQERDLLDSLGIEVITPHFRVDGERLSLGDANRRLGAMQADRLLSRGHERIAYAHRKEARLDVMGQERERGAAQRCALAGLEPPRSFAVRIDSADAAAELARLSVGFGGRSFAVVCYNDEVAMALLAGARALRRDVPGDIALIGCDHTKVGQVANPRLTTVEMDVPGAARYLAEDVIACLGGAPASLIGEPDSRIGVIDGESD